MFGFGNTDEIACLYTYDLHVSITTCIIDYYSIIILAALSITYLYVLKLGIV